jgi:hypothetical protein
MTSSRFWAGPTLLWVWIALVITAILPTPTLGFTSYVSQFMRVDYTSDGGWDNSTFVAQQTIINAANWYAEQAPWCEW